MLEELKEILKEAIKDDEFFKIVATGAKKSYDALIRVGFSEQQATQIIAGQGMGIKAS